MASPWPVQGPTGPRDLPRAAKPSQLPPRGSPRGPDLGRPRDKAFVASTDVFETELDSITIEGFKSIASIAKLTLQPINVIIGPNGSGKSNFIGVFSFLHEIREGRLQDYVRRAGGAEQLLHFGSRATPEIHISLSFRKGVNKYELSLRPTDDDSLYPASEAVSFWDMHYPHPYSEGLEPRQNGREAGISDPGSTGIAHWVRARLSRWRLAF